MGGICARYMGLGSQLLDSEFIDGVICNSHCGNADFSFQITTRIGTQQNSVNFTEDV